MSYFPYVTCVGSEDRILLFRQCFLVHYYRAIPFHIGIKGALECHLRINFSENKGFRKIRNTSVAVQVCTFKIRTHFVKFLKCFFKTLRTDMGLVSSKVVRRIYFTLRLRSSYDEICLRNWPQSISNVLRIHQNIDHCVLNKGHKFPSMWFNDWD